MLPWIIGLTVRLKIIRVLVFFAIALASYGTANALPPPGKTRPTAMVCYEGKNRMTFTFDGKGGAKLARIVGSEITLFADLKEPDWTVRPVLEQGGLKLRVANARGAVLFIPFIAEKTYAHITWNDPPNSKVDMLCDITFTE